MELIFHFFLVILLLLFAYVVFHPIFRRDYTARGRLLTLSSNLQLSVFIGFFSFPYQINPPEWAQFWMVGPSLSQGLFLAGMKNESPLTLRLILSLSFCAMPAMHRSTRAPKPPKPVEKTNGETVKGRSSTQTHQSD